MGQSRIQGKRVPPQIPTFTKIDFNYVYVYTFFLLYLKYHVSSMVHLDCFYNLLPRLD